MRLNRRMPRNISWNLVSENKKRDRDHQNLESIEILEVYPSIATQAPTLYKIEQIFGIKQSSP